MDTLPPELLRYTIPFLPLTSLIAARGVSKKWRTLSLTASLHPARKALLDIYLAAIIHPNFPSLVDALQSSFHEFDREAYITDLTSRGCVLPDLFEFWILEWPTKAVHFWAWPGLKYYLGSFQHDFYYDLRGNALTAATSPAIHTIPLPKKDVGTAGCRTCQGLALYKVHCVDGAALCELWLVVDANEGINDRQIGRLLWTIAAFERFEDGKYIFGSKKIFYDIPFGSPTDFKLVDFLDSLDFTSEQVFDIVTKFYSDLPLMEDEEE